MVESPAKRRRMDRTFTFLAHEAEEGGYWAECLELPGCVAQGETLEELKRNILEALEAVLPKRTGRVSTIMGADGRAYTAISQPFAEWFFSNVPAQPLRG